MGTTRSMKSHLSFTDSSEAPTVWRCSYRGSNGLDFSRIDAANNASHRIAYGAYTVRKSTSTSYTTMQQHSRCQSRIAETSGDSQHSLEILHHISHCRSRSGYQQKTKTTCEQGLFSFSHHRTLSGEQLLSLHIPIPVPVPSTTTTTLNHNPQLSTPLPLPKQSSFLPPHPPIPLNKILLHSIRSTQTSETAPIHVHPLIAHTATVLYCTVSAFKPHALL